MRLTLISIIFIWSLVFDIFVVGQNFYDSDPRIIEATARNFDKIVYSTNQTSLVEFYAPWCGYCKQLKPVMHRVGKKLDGIAQVVTVNCDQEKNKGLCSQHGVEGFPTLIVFRPPKIYKKGVKHASEKYQGDRAMKPIVDFIKSRVKNSIKKLRSIDTIQTILNKHHNTKLNKYSMILFSKTDTIPPVLKSIGNDWLGNVEFFMLHTKNIKTPDEETNKVQRKFASLYPNMASSLNGIIQKQSEKKDRNRLILLDRVNDKLHVYDGKQITKQDIAQFIHEITDIIPNEGPLSKREEYVHSLKTGKKSKKAKKNKHIRDEL
ncbi:hypothetical protein C6P45_004874 [Maudiozyma exigua]|uniref:Thioredoxin domain-containing protein n=1 Tax=Maudiozyma exigua TaxID=34358 RepID=A0A9P6WA19_MAUEX|nr:hypothetical protein C6P45_004874 [Kazachstania exigua]